MTKTVEASQHTPNTATPLWTLATQSRELPAFANLGDQLLEAANRHIEQRYVSTDFLQESCRTVFVSLPLPRGPS